VNDALFDNGGNGSLFSDEERDLLVKRLATCGLPPREIVGVTGVSSRTAARIMQRLGIKRKKPVQFYPFKKRSPRSLPEILGQYYALKEITLDSLDQLARRNGFPLKKLFDMIREHISPSRWAIRSCIACNQPTLSSSPADRYCPACKKKVMRTRVGMDDATIYE
jgi:hypothetical protein